MPMTSMAPRSVKRTVKKKAVPVVSFPKKMQIPTQDLHAKIELKAYELYVQRGRENGLDVEDWLKAEHLIKSQFEHHVV